jgi:hypothetical protein
VIKIKTGVEVVVVIRGYTAGNGNGHSQYVNEDIQLALHHTAPGYEQVIFNHDNALSVY